MNSGLALLTHPHHRPPARRQRRAPRHGQHHRQRPRHDQPRLRTTWLIGSGPGWFWPA